MDAGSRAATRCSRRRSRDWGSRIARMTTLPSLVLLAVAAASPAFIAEFKHIDSNEDGRVSSSEHEVYARTLFDEMDADLDYKLTIAEIMASESKFVRHVSAGVGGMLGGTQLTTAEKIQRIDANRDGVISRDEHADAARAKFQAMDVNNNGELSLGEFVAGG